MSDASLRSPIGQGWMNIVRKNGTREFAAAFAENPTLDTSVMNGTCYGAAQIGAFFAATGRIYDSIAFTDEAADGASTYMQWAGRAFGEAVAGATILTRDQTGLIRGICLYHRPFHLIVRISAELAVSLLGKVDPALFAHTTKS